MVLERTSRWSAVVPAVLALAVAAPAGAQPRRPLKPPVPPSKRRPPGSGRPAPAKDQTGEKPVNVAELMRLYEARGYHSLRGSLPYRLLRPAGYAPSRKYPMVVCLHGASGRGRDNALQLAATYPLRVLARESMRQKYPCFVLAPQSPTWWGDRPYGAPGGARAGAKDFPALTLLLDCIRSLQGVYSIDPDRVYLAGHGMGGFGVLNALAADANTFAAAVCVSGGGDPNTASRFYWTPLWLFAGENSRIRHYSETMLLAVRKFGAAPKYSLVKGASTRCWGRVFEAPAVWDWLFAQRRRPKPALPTTLPATLPATAPAARPAGGPGPLPAPPGPGHSP